MKNRNLKGYDRWIFDFKGYISDQIHPEDFAIALRAKLLASPSPHQFGESMLLDSLCNKPFGKWTEEQVREVERRQNDPGFLIALGRGTESGRKPPFNAIELAILKGWREVILMDEPFPGLRNWKPKAATCLLQAMGLLSGADHKTTFVDTRKALGLKPETVIVSDFNSENEAGDIEVRLKTGGKRILKRPR